jgi:hypothetical protein
VSQFDLGRNPNGFFPLGKYDAVLERIGQLQIKLGAPPDLMMLEKPASDFTASMFLLGCREEQCS